MWIRQWRVLLANFYLGAGLAPIWNFGAFQAVSRILTGRTFGIRLDPRAKSPDEVFDLVFTIAFGTESGEITDPVSGDVIPVPVRPEELAGVAETTGGASFVASSGAELADAYDEIRGSLGDTLGEEIEIVRELTWQWALAAFVLLAAAWALSLLWLRGMV